MKALVEQSAGGSQRSSDFSRASVPCVRSYDELPGFEDVYLEDSWVLGVVESADGLRLDLDLVLREQHPKRTPPKPDEMHCYVSAAVVFASPRHVEWTKQPDRPAGDASGELDWGNIDSFEWDGSSHALEGGWDAVIVEIDPPQLLYVDELALPS